MAFLKRWTRLLPAPAVALAVAAAVAVAAAGCSSSAASTAGSTGSASAASDSSGPAVTLTQARQIFTGYVATSDKAARTKNSALALSVVTGVQQGTLAAALKGSGVFFADQASAGSGYFYGQPAVIEYDYGTPVFYRPAPAGYPRFLVADVTRTLKTSAPAAGENVSWIAGVKVPVSGRVLMVFEQASVAAAWQLGSVSQLAPGTALPRLATDRNGLVPQVPLSGTGLLAQPDVTGPLQAAVVDDGPASAAVRAVATGPLTTGLFADARGHVTGLNAPRGDVYQWDMEGTPFPAFALRTADGGALVLYSLYLNSTVAVPDIVNKNTPVRAGAPIAIPAAFRPLLPKNQAAPTESLETQDLLSFAAIDPAATSGAAGAAAGSPPKVTVIAIGGGPNYATAR